VLSESACGVAIFCLLIKRAGFLPAGFCSWGPLGWHCRCVGGGRFALEVPAATTTSVGASLGSVGAHAPLCTPDRGSVQRVVQGQKPARGVGRSGRPFMLRSE